MDWSDKRIEPRFNIAPSQEILTIVQLPLSEPSAQSAVWGLKPFWLEGKRPPPINVRAESLASSAMARDASRCLIPATGFYEWHNRQPMHIQLHGGEVFAFAGLWLPPLRHGNGLPTAAILTTRPNVLMAGIHNRMPAILRQADERAWLDPSVSLAEAAKLLAEPLDAGAMEAYPVGPRVNTWENEGADLVEPIDVPPHEVQGTLPL